MKNFFKWICGVGAAFALVLILIQSKSVGQSVSDGIALCVEILIPSLFIFLILSDFALKTHALNFLLKPFGWICGKLFHIDKSFGPILFMSLVCGYPAGARMLSDLVSQGAVSRSTAERMLCFCVNAGPAFLIGSVGIPLFHSPAIGLIIYISHVIAFLAVGVLTGLGKTAEPVCVQTNATAPAQALVSSVQSSIRSMASICGFVLLFSGVLGLIKQFGILEKVPIEWMQAAITGALEVSNGVAACSLLPSHIALPLATAITAFGGVCVHCQVKAMLAKSNLSLAPYLRWRFLYCAISTTVCLWLSNIVSVPIPAASTFQTHPQMASQTPTSAILLIILSAALLCCDKKTVIIQKKAKILQRMK